MIDDLEVRASKALDYLEQTYLTHAEAKAELAYLQELRKSVVAMGFEDATGAGESRRQEAHNTVEYKAHIELIKSAEIQFHKINNRRALADTIIGLYRTQAANQRNMSG